MKKKKEIDLVESKRLARELRVEGHTLDAAREQLLAAGVPDDAVDDVLQLGELLINNSYSRDEDANRALMIARAEFVYQRAVEKNKLREALKSLELLAHFQGVKPDSKLLPGVGQRHPEYSKLTDEQLNQALLEIVQDQQIKMPAAVRDGVRQLAAPTPLPLLPVEMPEPAHPDYIDIPPSRPKQKQTDLELLEELFQ